MAVPSGSSPSKGEGGGGGGEEGEGKKKSLNVLTAALSLVSAMVGSGFLVLPKSLANTGWVGVALMVVFCAGTAFSGTRLGECWVMLEERWPERYGGGSRQPYMDIAERALGKPGRMTAAASLLTCQIGASIISLILMSSFLSCLAPQVSVCQCVLVVACTLLPLSWLGTPKDFWQVSMVAVVSTALACLVIFAELIIEIPEYPDPEYRNPTFFTFALGFGTMLFAFGGALIFSTIQNDMTDRSSFWKSVVVSYVVLLALYLPLSVGGYWVMGSDVDANILLAIDTDKWFVKAAIVMQIINLLGTYIVLINPVFQMLEDLLAVENRFGARRCALRSGTVLLVATVAFAVPSFDKIMNLVGGLANSLGCFFLPLLAYLRLVDMKGDWEHRSIPLWERTLLYVVMGVGVVGGAITTVTALMDILHPDSLGKSCFVTFELSLMQPIT